MENRPSVGPTRHDGPVTAENFQVDLRGIVDLFSHHLYSSPRVYVRELLQNAVDAISARPAAQRVGTFKDRFTFKTDWDDEARRNMFKHLDQQVA